MSYVELTLSQFLGVSKIVMDTLDCHGFNDELDDFDSVRIRIRPPFENDKISVTVFKV